MSDHYTISINTTSWKRTFKKLIIPLFMISTLVYLTVQDYYGAAFAWAIFMIVPRTIEKIAIMHEERKK